MPDTGKVKQSIPKELRYTVKDFHAEFPSDAACLEYVKEQRFPGGMADCPKCGKSTKHYRVGNRTAYACQVCGHHVYPLAGTIFEKSSTSLKTWFYAMYLMGSTRCGISAKQVQRETGVTYKTAWRMFRKIRSLLSDGDLQLEGPTVEVDETYMGGRRKGHRGRALSGDKVKVPVVGIVQRNGLAIARHVKNVKAKTLVGLIRKHVTPGSLVYTDEYGAYNTVSKGRRYVHRRIKHSSGIYVKNDIHTNSVEGLWSLIKRGIGGVYHHVDPYYLQSYLDEYCFRYNRRHEGNLQFKAILVRASERMS
ncbi:MAG: IS1595 family transposase [Candidatus Acidiferrales bacterium]